MRKRNHYLYGMRNSCRFFCLILLIGGLTANAQSTRKQVFYTDLGIGAGIYGANSNFGANHPFATVTTMLEGDLGYFLSDEFSLGFTTHLRGYYTEPEDTTVKSVQIDGLYLGISPRFHVINKPKFNMYAGISLGVSGFNYLRTDQFDNQGELRLDGVTLLGQWGLRYLFNSRIGFHWKVNYSINGMFGQWITESGIERNALNGVPIGDIILNIRGVESSIGFSMILGGDTSWKEKVNVNF